MNRCHGCIGFMAVPRRAIAGTVSRSKTFLRTALAALALLLSCAGSFGQTFTTLHSFAGGADGSFPLGALIQGQDGCLYGTTHDGGIGFGTIFKIAPDGSGFTTLYALPGILQGPWSGVSQGPDGSLYGTSLFGGSTGFAGAVFKAQPNGSGVSLLYSFTGGGDGAWPHSAPVVGGDGFLYGGTQGTGSANSGTVYKLATDGSAFSVLHAFNGSDGSAPIGAMLLGADSYLYGTTSNQFGIFKLDRYGGSFQLLHGLTSEYGGLAPLVQSTDGRLYGTTNGSTDGSSGGALFTIAPNGTGFSDLGAFSAYNINSILGIADQFPRSTVVARFDGNLYGSSVAGSTNGTLYRVAPDGSGYTTLYSFSPLDSSNINADGAYPLATVIGTDGNLYGTTPYGGAYGHGTIFRLNLASYSWSGYLQPINTDGSSIFKLGRTIPVKFQLTGASAGITNLVARLYIAKVSNSIIGTYMEASSTSAADSGNQFRYDLAGGQYIFNLGTNWLTAGTYQLKVDLGDGVQNRTVLVSLK